jgi:hypothetical protein
MGEGHDMVGNDSGADDGNAGMSMHHNQNNR